MEEAKQDTGSDLPREAWSFSPQLSGKLITNSTIQLAINNLDIWADTCCPLEPNELECWTLLYRVIANPNNSIYMDTIYSSGDPNEWLEQAVLFTCFNTQNEFYVKVPFSLTGYHIEFKMNCTNPKTDESSNDSDTITVSLPPYGIYNDYVLGDWVDFLWNGQFVEAEIVEKLDDNFYNLKFETFDAQKAEADDEHPWTEIHCKCHASKFVASSCEAIKILSGTNPLDRLFCSNVSDDDMITFYALADSLYQLRESEVECAPMEYHEMWVTDVPAQVFVAKHVMECLLGAQPFEYRISCLMNSHDGTLEMCNVAEDQLFMVRNGTFTVRQLETLKTSCDFCSCEVTKFDWIWQCQVDAKDCIERHCYCMWCIDQIIRLKQEMDDILHESLDAQLIEDCVTVISDYLIGKIRCSTGNKQQENALKRKIWEIDQDQSEVVDDHDEREDDVCFSSSKRRKINQ